MVSAYSNSVNVIETRRIGKIPVFMHVGMVVLHKLVYSAYVGHQVHSARGGVITREDNLIHLRNNIISSVVIEM